MSLKSPSTASGTFYPLLLFLMVSSYRVTDPRVAQLQGRLLVGAGLGRAEVQVLSPLTGHVLGTSEVRVMKQGESVAALTVRVVSGLSLALKSTGEEGQWQLSTVLGETLTSKFQVPEDAV